MRSLQNHVFVLLLACALVEPCASHASHADLRPKIGGVEARSLADVEVARTHHLTKPVERVYFSKALFDAGKWRWSVIYHSKSHREPVFAVLVDGDSGKVVKP